MNEKLIIIFNFIQIVKKLLNFLYLKFYFSALFYKVLTN